MSQKREQKYYKGQRARTPTARLCTLHDSDAASKNISTLLPTQNLNKENARYQANVDGGTLPKPHT